MYTLPTYDALLQQTLTDFENQIPGCDTSPGSDIYKKAVAIASALQGEYEYQDYIKRQVFAMTADSEHLEKHAGEYGLYRKAPNKASGKVTFTGQDATNIPVGTLTVDSDGVAVETTEAGDIAAGTLTLAAQAVAAGASGNLTLGTGLTVQNPPPGCDVAATVADSGSGTGFTGGTDLETDESLRERVLDRKQHPPAGGNAHDYIAWARSVSGVEDAYCYPLRLGLGSVTTVILTSGVGAARIPGPALVTAVQTYIDSVRPVAFEQSQVLAPTAKATAVTAAVSVKAGYSAASVKLDVGTAITALLNVMEPKETLYLSRLRAAVSDVEGVLDCTVTVPAANVVPVDDSGPTVEMITPGVITVNDL